MKTEKLKEFISQQILDVTELNEKAENEKCDLDKLLIKERQLGMLHVISKLQAFVIEAV